MCLNSWLLPPCSTDPAIWGSSFPSESLWGASAWQHNPDYSLWGRDRGGEWRWGRYLHVLFLLLQTSVCQPSVSGCGVGEAVPERDMGSLSSEALLESQPPGTPHLSCSLTRPPACKQSHSHGNMSTGFTETKEPACGSLYLSLLLQ